MTFSFFLGLHLAVEYRHPQVREGLLLQLFGVGRDGLPLVGEGITVPHQWADDEHLMTLLHLLAQEGVDPWTVALPQGKGIHLLPSRRQLVDDRHIQIAVDHQCQRPGGWGWPTAPAYGGPPPSGSGPPAG